MVYSYSEYNRIYDHKRQKSEDFGMRKTPQKNSGPDVNVNWRPSPISEIDQATYQLLGMVDTDVKKDVEKDKNVPHSKSN